MIELALLALLVGLVALLALPGARRRGTGRRDPVPVSVLRMSVHGDERRAYVVRGAAGGAQAPARGVVLAFHGGNGSPERFLARTGLSQAAIRSRHVIAFPEALGRWADGRRSVEAGWESDAEFMRWLIALFETDPRVEDGNLFALGVSNGAMFALRLGCEYGARFRGIAAVCGAIPADYADRAPPGPPVPVVLVNATEDRFIPWGGGEVPSMFGLTAGGRVLGVEDTVAFWCERNRCYGTPDVRSARIGDHDARIRDFRAGGDGAELCAIELIGAGHGWPGATGSGQTGLAKIVLDFFGRQREAAPAPEVRSA